MFVKLAQSTAFDLQSLLPALFINLWLLLVYDFIYFFLSGIENYGCSVTVHIRARKKLEFH